jgi:hypothetical protein
MRYELYRRFPNLFRLRSFVHPDGIGPITDDMHFVVRTFYGGDNAAEGLEGPFASEDEALKLAREHSRHGCGVTIYRCENMHLGRAIHASPRS